MLTMEDVIREGNPICGKLLNLVDMPLTEEEKNILNEMMTFLINSQDEEIAEKYKLRAGIWQFGCPANWNWQTDDCHLS